MYTENTMTVFDGSQFRYQKQYGNVRVTHEWNGERWVPVLKRKRYHNHVECWIERQPSY